MASSFVVPAVKRLSLPCGDWIDVKRELNVGDHRRLVAAGVRQTYRTNGALETELGWDYELERALVWIVEWSFRDEAGSGVKVSRSALESLTPEAFAEIQSVLSDHMNALAQEKKLKASALNSETPSTS